MTMPALAASVRDVLFLVCALLATSAGTTAQTNLQLPPAVDGKIDVEVSFFLIDVLKVLDAEQTIEADIFVRTAWMDPRLADTTQEGPRWVELDSIWYPALEPVSPRRISSLFPDLAMVEPDGMVSLTSRLAGTFGAPTRLANFPFDRHDVRFEFIFTRSLGFEIVAKEGPIVATSESLSIPDWEISGGTLDLTPIRLAEQIPELSAATYVIRAERSASYYITKVILPLVVIVMMSWTVFWAPPPQIAIQFGFAATSILTVIAYRFALASQMPRVPYTTRLDAFLNGAFVMAFLALVEVVVTAQLLYREATDTALRVDRICRVGFPLALGGLAIYSFAI
ncbi:MAG: hypothetical protein AAF726_23780 [Planctomycetota bacterium]